MIHQWNTGRAYDNKGQQRMVVQVSDKAIKFSDLSRNINGSIPLGVFNQFANIDEDCIEHFVMVSYDYGNYNPSDTTLKWGAFMDWSKTTAEWDGEDWQFEGVPVEAGWDSGSTCFSPMELGYSYEQAATITPEQAIDSLKAWVTED